MQRCKVLFSHSKRAKVKRRDHVAANAKAKGLFSEDNKFTTTSRCGDMLAKDFGFQGSLRLDTEPQLRVFLDECYLIFPLMCFSQGSLEESTYHCRFHLSRC